MSNFLLRATGRIHPSFRFASLPAVLLFLVAGLPSRAADREIYPAPEQAKIDLPAALRTAAAQHKRIILDFGGNWCGDCQVLDLYLHNEANRPILEANYVMVHINVGHLDENQAIAERYRIPLKRGVPALAVLDEHGKLLYSQESGEFERMRSLESSAVTRFLIQWKPVKAGCSAVQINC
jgi:thioredoxin 1